MTLHHTIEKSENRVSDSANPYPRTGQLWTAWNTGCMECQEPFNTLISSCENSQGDIYGFHNGACYQRHLLEYQGECCQWKDMLNDTPLELVLSRLRHAKNYLQDATFSIFESMELDSLYRRSKNRAERFLLP